MTARRWIDVPLTFGVTYLDELVDLSRNTIYMLLESGAIPATKVGTKWIVTRDAVMEWLDLDATALDVEDGTDVGSGTVIPLDSLKNTVMVSHV